jgi:hypothetical protein
VGDSLPNGDAVARFRRLALLVHAETLLPYVLLDGLPILGTEVGGPSVVKDALSAVLVE